MISQIDNMGDYTGRLSPCHYSRRIKSHFQAYGCGYDFCRFFLVTSDEKLLGIVSMFNSSMIVSVFDECEFSHNVMEELAGFVSMNKPLSIELDAKYSVMLEKLICDEYKGDKRTEFQFLTQGGLPPLEVDKLPRLQSVFDVLATSFPAIAQSCELWLTDTSHRLRRGLSQSFMLEDCTTATIQYVIDKTALVGHVATIPQERGKYHARKLLYWIGERLTLDGFDVRLFARPDRVSYYEEIGFEIVGEDTVLERIDENE